MTWNVSWDEGIDRIVWWKDEYEQPKYGKSNDPNENNDQWHKERNEKDSKEYWRVNKKEWNHQNKMQRLEWVIKNVHVLVEEHNVYLNNGTYLSYYAFLKWFLYLFRVGNGFWSSRCQFFITIWWNISIWIDGINLSW